MSAFSIFAFSSDLTGNSYYNSALRLESDNSEANLTYLASEINQMIQTLPDFDSSIHEHILNLRDLVVAKHGGWISAVELDCADGVCHSALFNFESSELEFFTGFFAQSEKVILIATETVALPVYLYITKEVSLSEGGLIMQRIELSSSAADIDNLVQNLIRHDSVLEVVVSHQSDLMIGNLNPDLLIEKIEKPNKLARHFQ
jgi:hypothetical protein